MDDPELHALKLHIDSVRQKVRARQARYEFQCRYGMLALDQADSQYRRMGKQVNLTTFCDDLREAGWSSETALGVKAIGTQSVRGQSYQRLAHLGSELGGGSQEVATSTLELISQAESLIKAKGFYEKWEDDLRQFDRTQPCMFVCSDVHLGTDDSEREAFEQALALCESKDTLLLLGDILHFWISDPTPDVVEHRLATYWDWLYNRLLLLKARGVSIRYVPGNHDPFVFTLYSGTTEWSADLRAKSTFLQNFEKRVAGRHPLTQVASIDYPFFSAVINGEKWLFTHGHIHQWWWALLGSDSDRGNVGSFRILRNEIPWAFAWLSAVASDKAYKHASLLRTFWKAKEAIRHPRRFLGDVAMLITHEALRASEIARELRTRDWGAVHAKIEDAFILYTAMTTEGEAMRENVYNGLKELERLFGDMHEEEAAKKTREWIKEYPNSFNYSIYFDYASGDNISRDPKRVVLLSDFVHFVCGHFHKPTSPVNGKPTCVDSGAMYEGVTTMLQINQITGWIGRPAGIQPGKAG
jgi:hypothetical protein